MQTSNVPQNVPQSVSFTDIKCTIVKSKRKNGKSSIIWEEVTVIENIYPVSVSFDVKITLYIRESDKDARFKRLYNLDGSLANGLWQHGRYGSKTHLEPIQLDVNKRLITTTSYASGQIKDQHKYLKSIDVK